MTLSSEQRDRLAGLAASARLDLILQFGSTISGKTHPSSDLDLAVRFEDGRPDSRRLSQVLRSLQEVFPDVEVDVSVINAADPLHLFKICESPVLLFGATRALHELKILAFKRYQDHRRFFAMERAFVDRYLDGRGRHS